MCLISSFELKSDLQSVLIHDHSNQIHYESEKNNAKKNVKNIKARIAKGKGI